MINEAMTKKSMFKRVLDYLDKTYYKPNKLILEFQEEEKQNEKYGGGKFKLSGKTIRLRVSKITPSKQGQFVSFWEKNNENVNQAYHYKDSPDLLVIHCFKDNDKRGQFVFPKEALLKFGILQSNSSKGKMGMRVYPIWNLPTNKQALKTQAWQAKYFIDLSNQADINYKKFLELYS